MRQFKYKTIQSMTSTRFTIEIYTKNNNNSPFIDWIESLDIKTQARIRHRILRMEMGNFGDYKVLQDGLCELRLFFGPGYRVYFGVIKDQIVLLISGGDKNTQKKDIQKALAIWQEYKMEI